MMDRDTRYTLVSALAQELTVLGNYRQITTSPSVLAQQEGRVAGMQTLIGRIAGAEYMDIFNEAEAQAERYVKNRSR